MPSVCRLTLCTMFLLASCGLSQAQDSLPVSLGAGWNLIGLPDTIAADRLLALDPALQGATALRDGALVDTRGLRGNLVRGESVAIYSKQAITLNLPLPITDKNSAPELSDVLDIPAGISARALPVDMVVSPRLLGDRLVLAWDNGNWRAYPNAAAKRYGYDNLAPLQSLKPGQGFLLVGDAPLKGNWGAMASELKPFADTKEMKDYLREQAITMRSFGVAPTVSITSLLPAVKNGECSQPIYSVPVNTALGVTAVSSLTGGKTTNATSTNVQERGVDESDIVKHDGKTIFYAQSFTKRILVSSFDAISQGSKPLGEIALGQCVNIEAMYLVNNRLALVYGAGNDYWGGWFTRNYNYWNNESTLEIYDVSNPSQARKLASKKIEGTVVDSRVIEQRLHLIVRYVPYIEVEYSAASTGSITVADTLLASKPAIYPQPDYSNPILKTERLIPYITDTMIGVRQPIFTPEKFYAPAKLDQYTNTLSVLAFDIDTGALKDQVGIFGNQDTVYMSTRHLYTVSADYPAYYGWSIAPNNETRSKIHRFSVAGQLEYKGSAFVDGTVLNQFSLGESDDVLRIATTRRFWDKDWRSNTDNQVATFAGDSATRFAQLGVLGGLGKAGETIRSARFVGNKGYLVTFRNTDPLYTLDLSNPAAPKKVGELSIPGYSSYLQPIDDNRVLAIGRNASPDGTVQGVLLQLFDISNFAEPRLADKRVYGKDWNTRSSAENDAKALTYRADGVLGFDLQTTLCSADACKSSTALKLLRLDGMKLKDSADLPASGSDAPWNTRYRNILFDRDGKTWAAFLAGENWAVGEVKP